MFRFFRSIRQGLVNEGKTSKYFRYALGEIILVVVGILIALQINNWNEDRKDRILEREYVERLIQDLLEDQRIMTIAMDRGEVKLASANKVLLALADPESVRKSPSLAIPSTAYSFARPDLQTTTFNELMSSGNLRLIRDKQLRFEVGDHYRNVEHSFERLDERRTQLVWAKWGIFPKGWGPQEELDALFFADPHVEERLDRLLSYEFQELIYHERNYSIEIVDISREILELTEAMLESLRAYQREF